LLVVGRFLDRRPVADFGFHLNGGWFVDLGFGMFLGAFLMTGIFLVQLLIGWTSVSDTLVVVGSGNSFVLAILPPIAIFLCVGIYEEAFSRGYQLRNIAEGLNYPALGPRTAIILALVLTSAFFGLLHASNPNATAISTFNIALAGLLLGAGYVLTGELSIPIGLHITWNFFQGNVYGFPVSGLETFGATFIDTQQAGPDLWTGGPFGPEAGLLGLLAMLTGTLLIALYTKARTGKLDLHTPLAEPPTKSSNTPETSPE
jgi:membrane protease YdiL (CAAX protease family)